VIKPSSSSVPASQVVLDQPGLRDYKKRLSGDKPIDPFTSLPGQGATGTSAVGGSAGGTSPGGAPLTTQGQASGGQTQLTPEGQQAAAEGTSGSTSPTTTSTGSTTPSTSGGSSGSSGQSGTKYYTYRVKLRAGQPGNGSLKTYDSVGTLANVPNNNVSAAAYLGVTKDSKFNAKTAVFLVSPEVSSVSGEGDCTYAGSACQLLALKPGQHEDLVWSDGLTYRIELVKFLLVSRNQLPSVGNSNSGSSGNSGGTGRKQKHGKQTSFYFSF
jgi:hypothetical protein